MTRKRILMALTLLVFGGITLQCSDAPLSTVRHAPPVAHLVETHDDVSPASVGVRTLGLNTREGMGLLDQHAEVVFDD